MASLKATSSVSRQISKDRHRLVAGLGETGLRALTHNRLGRDPAYDLRPPRLWAVLLLLQELGVDVLVPCV